MQKVQGWRTALTAAANLKGFDIRDGIESEKIQQIIDHISSKFCKSAPFLSYLLDVVGIHAHLEELKSLLQIEINDVRIVGIWGIGGIGKTTIAKAIFDTLSHQFKVACFLANVKENAKKNQLHSLQNTLLSELLRKKDDYVNNEYDGKCMIQSRLSSMKVLIVLDDIDHGDHLEYLAGDVGWFGNGSRVIVTTRNRQLIEKDAAIYEVPTLPDDEAMQLFNQHAFKKEVPDECFKKFSLEVVNYAKGLPLALKVWGSTLHKKGVDKWKKIVDKIKKKSNSEIVEKLKISYDGLEPEEEKIFLDIACFFRGDNREQVMRIVESYDSGAEFILDVLIDKSLVFISKYDRIEMHDLIEDMGKYIVKMQRDSGKPSRVWNVEDFEDVMMDNMGTMTVEAICLKYCEKVCFSKESMQNMRRLRILCMHTYQWGSQSYSEYDSMEYLPNNLCCFVWDFYPWKLLPENFNPRRLVHLELQWSSLHYLCNETKVPSLESLNLKYCSSLEKFPEILGIMKQGTARKITMSYSGIRELPLSFFDLQPHLTELHLNGMEHLVSLPSSICKLKGLVKLSVPNCSKLESLPEDIGSLSSLKVLNLSGNNFKHLPQSISKLGALKYLVLANCKKLTQLPEFPQQLHGINADWSNDLFCNLLFQNISSLQHAICSSHFLSLRVIWSWGEFIPSWFKYQGMGTSVSVNLPMNWYVSYNLLGFALCYSGEPIDYIIAHLIPLCDDGMSSMTQEFALSKNSTYSDFIINFLLVPLGGFWDASNANGKTPNDYGCIKLDFIGETNGDFGNEKKIGVRLLYKNES
ncbi:hypothetical protein R3W88_028594 [Solanum pinnatisectum]|uniref:ADP-ribosyl cyclase/cyclic ADP-ribose hydrolase n=1 Tax=Solanum pinnatisectum TaxID=50273 RepID=A0AAV9K2W8_9SOLN|nr:hypothetical protein R3W88_028594 [Solanum pinnatisectum]